MVEIKAVVIVEGFPQEYGEFETFAGYNLWFRKKYKEYLAKGDDFVITAADHHIY